MGDVFQDHLELPRPVEPARSTASDKFDVADDRCFVGFDAYKKVIDCGATW